MADNISNIRLPQKRFNRFALVGLVNTAVDVVTFIVLYNIFDVNLVLANAVATGTALLVGYALHSNYTFEKSGGNVRIFAAYLTVTLVGLWLLQPLVILTALPLLTDNPIIALNQTIALTLAKGGAIAATLVWNYIWYSKVIFADNDNRKTATPGNAKPATSTR